MGKITVLAGNLRKNGNTDRLVEAFAKGPAINNGVEIISVSDHNVKPCTGCNSCFEREGNRCFQNDDMTEIYEKMNGTDALIIASPVYFYGISAS